MPYFAYGSNMNERQFVDRCPSARFVGIATLRDHRLQFTRRSINRGCGVADAVAAQGHRMWGVVYEMPDADLPNLDRSEGFQPGRSSNSYWRRHCVAFLDDDDGRPISAFTYFAEPQPEPAPTEPSLQGSHRRRSANGRFRLTTSPSWSASRSIRDQSGRSVWQISAGRRCVICGRVPAARRRSGRLRATPGRGRPDARRRRFEGGFVRRFASEIAVGRRVPVCAPASRRSLAVGLVGGDYLYANAFDDVNGWDLQHARRVRWCRLPEAVHVSTSRAFGANPPRCSRVSSHEVVDFRGALHSTRRRPTGRRRRCPNFLPSSRRSIDVPDALQGIVAQAADLVPLFSTTQSFGEPPSEDELIVALRRAVPAGARLAAGADRRQVALHRRRGVPGSAAHRRKTATS